MKREHILNLWLPIDLKTRLDVYKEAYKEKETVKKNGLLVGVPMILWGIKSSDDKSPDGKKWSAGLTPRAFPEITNKVILYIDNNKENKEKLRMQFLSSCIKKITLKLEENSAS